jgi:hypothetical protein
MCELLPIASEKGPTQLSPRAHLLIHHNLDLKQHLKVIIQTSDLRSSDFHVEPLGFQGTLARCCWCVVYSFIMLHLKFGIQRGAREKAKSTNVFCAELIIQDILH